MKKCRREYIKEYYKLNPWAKTIFLPINDFDIHSKDIWRQNNMKIYKKRNKINKCSSKKKLRNEIGKIHLDILRIKRGDRCEICQIPGNVGRFHILPVGTHMRLEFCDENVILCHWMNNCQAHYLWHHAGPHDARNKRTLNKIVELRGQNWEEELRRREILMPKHDSLYLMALRETMKKELASLKGLL